MSKKVLNHGSVVERIAMVGLYPKALLHFEDFGPSDARKILVENSQDYRIFDDDMQGAGAIVMAAVFLE